MLAPMQSRRHREYHQAWDTALDNVVSQLLAQRDDAAADGRAGAPAAQILPLSQSNFFSEQLVAFEVWLRGRPAAEHAPPEQLPILLQVLLSPTYRLRALALLARFTDLGPSAVRETLAVGLFPYLLKLLLAPSADLRQARPVTPPPRARPSP